MYDNAELSKKIKTSITKLVDNIINEKFTDEYFIQLIKYKVLDNSDEMLDDNLEELEELEELENIE